MLKNIKKTPLSISIVSLSVIFMIAFSLLAVNFSTVLFILISGCVGLLVHFITLRKREGEK